MNTDVAVLFARRDSVYKSLAGCDVWDIDRDAMTWTGGAPVVAHPPCRAWGRLRTFAKPREFERSTGPFAIDQVRAWGGVVEHPSHSSLWLYCGLPAPGHVDRFGGWTLPISQSWFGHRAEKATWLHRWADHGRHAEHAHRPRRGIACRQLVSRSAQRHDRLATGDPQGRARSHAAAAGAVAGRSCPTRCSRRL